MVAGRVKERTFFHWGRSDLPVEVDTGHAWTVSRHWQSKLVRADDSELMAKVGKTRDDAFAILTGRLKYATELLKEYVFEDVRRASFPDLPSRRSCIYLFDSSHDPNQYAETMRLERGALYRIEVASGRLHRAQFATLDCNARDHAEVVDHARRYWTHVEPGDGTEVLFEGTCRITRV